MFNLPNRKLIHDSDEINVEADVMPDDALTTLADITELMEVADKIDAALPQVSSIESLDVDLDKYAQVSMDVFTDLVDLGKNVEDRHAAAIFDSATRMMQNALTAKTIKANKKLEMIKLQIQKAKLVHDQEKLDFAKQKYLTDSITDKDIASDGNIVATRNDLLTSIISDLKK